MKSDNDFQNSKKDENSSSESLVEVKLNEYVKRSELKRVDIRALVVRCSSCGSQINHVYNKDTVKRHRKLGVITCQDCYEFYGSSEFSQDESGYNYCSWCGNGGKLFVCDFCPNGFCGACIRRNFGRAEISITMKNGWKCYCCDNTRLKSKQKFCDLIIDFINNGFKVQKEREKKSNKNVLTEAWLQTAFDSSFEACKTFHKKLNRLKIIGMANSKSLRHVVSKMEQVINHHKTNLKVINKSLSEEYLKYIELKRSEELQMGNETQKGCTILDDVYDNHVVNKDIRDKCNSTVKDDSIVDNDSDMNNIDIIDETPEKIESTNKANGLDHPKSQNGEDEHAKLLLLQSESESESGAASLRHLLSPVPAAVDDNSTGPHEKSSKIEDPDSNVAKQLLLFSSESELSDMESTKNDFPKEKCTDFEISDAVEVPDIDINTDAKLKSKAFVKLTSCDSLLENGSTTLKMSCKKDDNKLDKEILRLCRFPIVTKRISKDYNCTNVKPKKAVSPPRDKDSSSSIILSSDDEFDKEDQQKRVPSIENATLKVNSDAIDSDHSSISMSPSEESEAEEKSNKSKRPQKIESDSSDDFQPARKRRKYDKLLDAPILSDSKKGEGRKKKEKTAKKRRILSSDEEANEPSGKNRSRSSSSSESDEELRKKSRKQSKKRRVKTMDDSSSEDNDKLDGEAPSQKGRKNIQKIIKEEKLKKSTKEAQLEEKERRRRIEERQKLYNKITDTSADGKEIITRKMVLEVDQDSKEEIVEIHPDLVCKLKPHQVNGVKFMWECTVESVKDLHKPGSGCILAHCMGLGKTLQVIAFLHTCLSNPIVGEKIKRAMVICPYNTCLNWSAEFEHWLEDIDPDVRVHQLTDATDNLQRLDIIKYWYRDGGVIIVSYDIFRRLTASKINKLKQRDIKSFHACLLDPGPDIVICDEGHILKNETSAISKATDKFRTMRRIVLTGTPLQNNLKEYHCMLHFVKPNLLGTMKEFRNRFVNPIINGQHADSNGYDVKLMKKRIHILHKLLEGCVQRCDYRSLTKFLPPKHEYVISVKLSDVQVKMYECYLEKLTNAKNTLKNVGSTLFIDFNNLRCIWNHPYLCHISHEKQEFKRLMKDDAEEDDFINDNSVSEPESSESSELEENSDEEVIVSYKTRSRRREDKDDEVEEVQPEIKQWYHEFISDEDKCNIEISGKMTLLIDILKECEAIGDKIIVFSQSLLTLNAIEDILKYLDEHPVSTEDSQRDVIGKWIKGIDYFRMDGTTNAGFRKNYITMFNDTGNIRARLFLISTKAGSLGTNLVGANRVVVFDTSWNPSHDVQAIFRVYRFGQTKPVYIYRFLAQGTMEEKIYDRQVTKLSLSCRVVDEQQIERHFNASDLAELYMFDRNSTSNRPTPMVPKDRLLAEMLIKNKDWIVTYHEHDSLLENIAEEDLTEDERQAAWAEYENEREGKTDLNNVNADGSSFFSEPDFNEGDYQGKKIPELGVIMNIIYSRLSSQMPGLVNTLAFRKKLYAAVSRVRQVFQEKHVNVLRLKQEFMQNMSGVVPNSVNKYLEELTTTIRSTGEYILRLHKNIEQDEGKERRFKEQITRMQQTGIRGVSPENFIRLQNFSRGGQSVRFPHPMQMNVPPTSFNPQNFAYASQRPAMFRNYSRNSKVSTPTIIEADEVGPEASNTDNEPVNTTSTVIIEEIP